MMSPEEFWNILNSMPEPKPVEHRLYYDSQGDPVVYSMDDLPGNYIQVDAETFARSPRNVRVVNGELRYIHTAQGHKLVPGPAGKPCDLRDISVVVDATQPHQRWSRRTYESS